MDNEEFDFNCCLKDVVEQMHNEPSEEKFIHVLAELIIRVNDEGTVPTPMQSEMHVVWGVSTETDIEDVFPEDMDIGNRIVILVNEREGYKWLPLYTGRDEIKNYTEANTIKEIYIREILEQVADDEEFTGIIINPDTDFLVIHREAVEFVLKHADGSFRHTC